MNKILWALFTSLLLVSAFLLGYGLNNGFHRDPQIKANVFVIHESMNGKQLIGGGNVITNIAENTIRNLIGHGNATSGTAEIGTNTTKYISVGNATAAATLTQLTTEAAENGFTRAEGAVVAWQNGTDYAFNVSKTFQCATAAETINCAGLNWYTSGNNNLFACADITQTAFAVNDNCTITWVITIDAN